ncbi:hypothetical protein BU23DRAFT_565248 [Bimuria novae-zelandiae CBS 107.79]|uniref:BTB domain-containing protein n=1 Tax=Bimuria novae-zelandiae CBS 107.79 TaxID=1447943 RepID=A0A6A5VKE6_9PLEO|nr:hypothetical protein BU23DRAFT_565248 [Bimuria novae-zelandiae CBS 107.79]
MSNGKKISKQLGGNILTVVFFRGAMAGTWKESEDRVVPLPENDPQVFALYLQAIYNGHVELDDFDKHYNIIAWASVYTLADKLIDMDIKNIVIKKFYEIRDDLWTACITAPQAVQITYDQTPGPCGMRQLFIDSAVYHYKCPQSDKGDFADAMKDSPREFLEDMAVATVTKKLEVINRMPDCSCPDTYAFFDYIERYIESKETKINDDKVEGSEDMKGKKKTKKGKGKNKNEDKAKAKGSCSHGRCCRCDQNQVYRDTSNLFNCSEDAMWGFGAVVNAHRDASDNYWGTTVAWQVRYKL